MKPLKTFLAIIIAIVLATSCSKSVPQTKLTYLYLKVQKDVTMRFIYTINDFHIIVYSDSTFKTQVIPPNTIYVQLVADGSIANYELKNSDNKIFASDSVRITRVIYEDKNTIFKF